MHTADSVYEILQEDSIQATLHVIIQMYIR